MKRIFGFLFLSILFATTSNGQNSLAIAAADTTHFTPNNVEGWQFLNSYFESHNSDSCYAEMVFQHDNDINWNSYQLTGKIKSFMFVPNEEKVLSFDIGSRSYYFKIDQIGNCWIKQKGGAIHEGDKVVIALKLVYKK